MNEYMKMAREQAEKGMKSNEGGPFGAVITCLLYTSPSPRD